MADQTVDDGEQLLLTLNARNTTRTIKDFSPAGISIENDLEGESKGIFNATYYATIVALIKPDGTIDYVTRQIHTTDKGETILLTFTGKSIRESPTHNRFVGENTFQTAAPEFAWLNGLKSRHDGEYNPVTGEQNLRVYGKK